MPVQRDGVAEAVLFRRAIGRADERGLAETALGSSREGRVLVSRSHRFPAVRLLLASVFQHRQLLEEGRNTRHSFLDAGPVLQRETLAGVAGGLIPKYEIEV